MVSPHGRLFGTNGVRFIPGVTADLEFVIKFSECVGTYFSEGEVLVGRDGRLSGEAMLLATTSGLMSSGRPVAEAGLVPTPALQYATRALGYRGGVMATASHNPPEYNGLKVVGPDGVEINRLDEQKVEKIFRDGSFRRADWKEVGTARSEPSVIRTYLNGILSKVNTRLISARKFSVVVDPGNGAQCLAAPNLLDALGCKIITINSIIDGRFPGRGPEPTPETLGDLGVAVRAWEPTSAWPTTGTGTGPYSATRRAECTGATRPARSSPTTSWRGTPDATVVTPISSSQVIEAVAAEAKGEGHPHEGGQRRRLEDDNRAGGLVRLRGERGMHLSRAHRRQGRGHGHGAHARVPRGARPPLLEGGGQRASRGSSRRRRRSASTPRR